MVGDLGRKPNCLSENVINKQVLENLTMNNFSKKLTADWPQRIQPVVRGRLRILIFDDRDHPGKFQNCKNLTIGEAQVENTKKKG